MLSVKNADNKTAIPLPFFVGKALTVDIILTN